MNEDILDKAKSIKINSPLELGYYKGNIVFIHHYNHKTFRYNAFKVQEDCFNKKTKALKSSDSYDCKYEVEKIEALAKNVNKAIIEISKTKDNITKKEIDEYIANNLTEVEIASSDEGLIADFTKWIEVYKKNKNKELINKGEEGNENHPSSKDYTSAKNLLIDYQWDYEWENHERFRKYPKQLDDETGVEIRKFMYDDIDDDFITNLIEYCYLPRVNTKTHKYKTEGDMVNKTIQKRMDSLFTFLNSKYGKLPNEIVKPQLKIGDKEIIRLDREELRQLENLDIKDERFIKVRDYFLFLCYTGLRYGDFVKLDKTFYNKKMNELHLSTQKTSVNCRIYLFDKAKEIGEKYNYSFKGHTNQSLNRAIKDLLQEYELYTDIVTVHYMQQGLKVMEKPKNEFITCHTGRKTFISIMIEKGMDVYDLMGMTGHRRHETLKHYLDLFGEERRLKFQRINGKLK